MAKTVKGTAGKTPAKKISGSPVTAKAEPTVKVAPAPVPAPAPVKAAPAVAPARTPVKAPPTSKLSAKAAKESSGKIAPEDRHQMIAEAAYFIAVKNGFNSDPTQNWAQAEAQIDAKLKADGRL